MSTQDQSLTLTAPHHEKLGSLHCGVTREGFIAVAGDTADIEDGEEIEFDHYHVSVKRTGGEYTFTRHN